MDNDRKWTISMPEYHATLTQMKPEELFGGAAGSGKTTTFRNHIRLTFENVLIRLYRYNPLHRWFWIGYYRKTRQWIKNLSLFR